MSAPSFRRDRQAIPTPVVGNSVPSTQMAYPLCMFIDETRSIPPLSAPLSGARFFGSAGDTE
jgi:hypothetical protein